MTRDDQIELAKELREQGFTLKEIGQRVGKSTYAIWTWLNPEKLKAENKRRRRAKREWESGECPQCGQYLGSRKRSRHCANCAREESERKGRERTIRFIALRKEGLLNREIARKEGISAHSVAVIFSRGVPRYGLDPGLSPYFTRGRQ